MWENIGHENSKKNVLILFNSGMYMYKSRCINIDYCDNCINGRWNSKKICFCFVQH